MRKNWIVHSGTSAWTNDIFSDLPGQQKFVEQVVAHFVDVFPITIKKTSSRHLPGRDEESPLLLLLPSLLLQRLAKHN